jgi:hypothetical protein
MNGTNPDRAPAAIERRLASVESCAQEGRDDEQDSGTFTSRPRRTGGDLVPARELLTPAMRRLLGGEECETPNSGATS